MKTKSCTGKWDADLEKVAKSFLEHVRNHKGGWVRGADAFHAAIEKHPDLGWVEHIKQRPKAKTKITKAIERIRNDHEIERKKCGDTRQARAFFRLGHGKLREEKSPCKEK